MPVSVILHGGPEAVRLFPAWLRTPGAAVRGLLDGASDSGAPMQCPVRVYPSLDAALAEGPVEIVHLCGTCGIEEADVVRAALRRKCDVLHQPFPSWPDAVAGRLEREAKRARVRLRPFLPWRFAPAFARLLEFVESGAGGLPATLVVRAPRAKVDIPGVPTSDDVAVACLVWADLTALLFPTGAGNAGMEGPAWEFSPERAGCVARSGDAVSRLEITVEAGEAFFINVDLSHARIEVRLPFSVFSSSESGGELRIGASIGSEVRQISTPRVPALDVAVAYSARLRDHDVPDLLYDRAVWRRSRRLRQAAVRLLHSSSDSDEAGAASGSAE